jgi:hypothetical protein
MLENIKGLNGWRCKDCEAIYKFWKQRIVKQNELNGDLKFTMIIGLGGKWLSHWKTNRK